MTVCLARFLESVTCIGTPSPLEEKFLARDRRCMHWNAFNLPTTRAYMPNFALPVHGLILKNACNRAEHCEYPLGLLSKQECLYPAVLSTTVVCFATHNSTVRSSQANAPSNSRASPIRKGPARAIEHARHRRDRWTRQQVDRPSSLYLSQPHPRQHRHRLSKVCLGWEESGRPRPRTTTRSTVLTEFLGVFFDGVPSLVGPEEAPTRRTGCLLSCSIRCRDFSVLYI